MIANTGGPVLCLDAGSRLSYPGSGTTWTDLSGNGNTVPLTNGAGYDGNSLIYNGTDQRTHFDLPTLKAASITISAWFKQTKAHTGGDTTIVAGITDGVGWRYGYSIGFISTISFSLATVLATALLLRCQSGHGCISLVHFQEAH